jgi:ribonuclease P protein component
MRSHAFPRSARLLRTGEYDRVYRDGRRRTAQHLVVFYRANGLSRSRLGISVKRTLGTAVERNRIRRRLREVFRTYRQEIPAGWDIVIHPRSGMAQAEFAAFGKELVSLLQQALV